MASFSRREVQCWTDTSSIGRVVDGSTAALSLPLSNRAQVLAVDMNGDCFQGIPALFSAMAACSAFRCDTRMPPARPCASESRCCGSVTGAVNVRP